MLERLWRTKDLQQYGGYWRKRGRQVVKGKGGQIYGEEDLTLSSNTVQHTNGDI